MAATRCNIWSFVVYVLIIKMTVDCGINAFYLKRSTNSHKRISRQATAIEDINIQEINNLTNQDTETVANNLVTDLLIDTPTKSTTESNILPESENATKNNISGFEEAALMPKTTISEIAPALNTSSFKTTPEITTQVTDMNNISDYSSASVIINDQTALITNNTEESQMNTEPTNITNAPTATNVESTNKSIEISKSNEVTSESKYPVKKYLAADEDEISLISIIPSWKKYTVIDRKNSATSKEQNIKNRSIERDTDIESTTHIEQDNLNETEDSTDKSKLSSLVSKRGGYRSNLNSTEKAVTTTSKNSEIAITTDEIVKATLETASADTTLSTTTSSTDTIDQTTSYEYAIVTDTTKNITNSNITTIELEAELQTVMAEHLNNNDQNQSEEILNKAASSIETKSQDGLTVKGIANKTIYTVNPNYKPLKKLEVVPPKPFLRDPDDNSWRNESISSLGIVFKPKNSTKSLTQVLKNKTESDYLSDTDSGTDTPDLREKLEKLTEKRKSKKNKSDKSEEINESEFVSTRPIDPAIMPVVTISKMITDPTTYKSKENKKIYEFYISPDSNKQSNDHNNIKKIKQPVDYYENVQFDHFDFPDIKKNYVSTKQTPPLIPTVTTSRTRERKPTIQYFPPRERQKPLKNFNKLYKYTFVGDNPIIQQDKPDKIKQINQVVPVELDQEYYQTQSPVYGPPVYKQTSQRGPAVHFDHNPFRQLPRPLHHEEQRCHEAEDIELSQHGHTDADRIHYQPPPQQRFETADDRQPSPQSSAGLDRPLINHFLDELHYRHPNHQIKSNINTRPSLVLQNDFNFKPSSPKLSNNIVESKLNIDRQYDGRVFEKFIQNFNENSERFRVNYPVVYNSSIVHRAENGMNIASSSSAYLSQMQNEREKHGVSLTPSQNTGGAEDPKRRGLHCENGRCSKTVELAPEYEIHYFISPPETDQYHEKPTLPLVINL